MLGPAVFIRLGLSVTALLLITFFASMEAAFCAVDRLALSHLSFQKKDKAHLALNLSENREQLLATILMGTNLSVVLFTVSTTSLALQFSPFGIYTVPATALLTVLLINVFGELIPKTRASKSPIRYALNGTRILSVVHHLMFPLSYILVALPKLLLSKSATESEDTQIREMVEYAEEQNTLPLSEKDMILGILDSGRTQVKEIMLPRVDMSAADIEDGIPGLLDIIRESEFSRIPVFEHSIDNIVGIIYAKDLLPYLYGSRATTTDIKQLLKPALYVPGSKAISNLLRDLQESRTHMAIVIDEYGGVAGLVTIEDILEEIVGEIRDEYDQDEEVIGITPQPDGSLLIHGRVSLDDLSNALGDSLEQATATTTAGLVLERLGNIPRLGECIEIPETGHTLCVEQMHGRRIQLIRATKSTNIGRV